MTVDSGRLAGVVTGVVAARHELVVVADDDVRYGREEMRDMAFRLGDAHLVRPQNVFRPLPWHARSACIASGGYDGDALFENLQLIRTLLVAEALLLHRPVRRERADTLGLAA